MKIAVIILWSEPWGGSGKTGGLISAGMNLARELGADLLYIPPSARRKPRPAHHSAYRFATVEEVLTERYDFVVFTSAGHYKDHKQELSAVEHVLSRLKEFPPFAIEIHDEVEIKQLIHSHRFWRCPSFRFALPITAEIGERFARAESVPMLVYPAYAKHIEPHATPGAKSIGMSSRMASRKNTIPFLRRAAPGLIADGWRVEIHGAEPNFFYARETKRIASVVGAEYHGPYAEPEPVLRGLRWHVNIPYLKNGSFIPRIELASVEAAAAGCGLITLAETTPREIPTLRVAFADLEKLSDILKDERAREVNARFVRWFNAKHASMPRILRGWIENYAG